MKLIRPLLSGIAALAIATLATMPAAAAPTFSPTDLLCPSSNQLVMGEFIMDASDPNKPAADNATGDTAKAKKPDAETQAAAKANSSTKDKVAKTKTAKAKKPAAPPEPKVAADDSASKQFKLATSAWVNGKKRKPGHMISVTQSIHAELFAAGAVKADWGDPPEADQA